MRRSRVSAAVSVQSAARLLFVLLGAAGAHAAGADTLYQVTIDTTSLAGTAGTLAFDFTDGGAPANQVSISALETNGTLGASATTGAVSGSAATSFTLSDTAFFSELVQGVTLGKQVTFVLDATTNAPAPGSLSDTLSFFLLDGTGDGNSATAASLITTTDPTQSNSLFTLQIDGTSGADVSIFGASPEVPVTFGPVSTGPGTGTSVPEPGILPLMACALGVFAAWRWHRRRRLSPANGNRT